MDGQERGAVMHTGPGSKSTTTIAAACLVFGLLMAGCTQTPEAAPSQPGNTLSVTTPSPTGSGTPPTASSAVATPGPGVPSVAGPAAPPPLAGPTPASSPAGDPSHASTPSSGPAPSSAPASGPATSAGKPVPVVEPSPQPGTSAPEPSVLTSVVPVAREASGPAVYYVAIDDGGARGVRFGCNDSLVPVRGVAAPGDPLTVALGRLLEAGLPVDSDAALYDSLADSSLEFLSGYMSGSTVVVNLSGSLRPGGVCDIPRIQAQLTHTVVSATGASRAEIYVNGRTLTEALSVR